MLTKIACEYRLEVGTALLQLSNLKKRIQGIKIINEAIRAVRQAYAQHRLMTSKELIGRIRQLDVMGQVFGGNTHYQLVHRSQDLIRLLFNEKEVDESEIDMIWDVCLKQGQQIKLEVYKIILEVLRAAYSCMTDATKGHFINKMVSMPPEQVIAKDIEIVMELGKKGGVAYRPPEGYIVTAAGLLWSIAVLERPYPRSVTEVARRKFCEQIQAWDDSFKETYVARCLDNISHQKYPLQNLKIAMKLIEKMNTGSYQAPIGRRNRQEFAQDLVETQDFAGLIISDLEAYIEYANTLVQRGELTVDNHKTLELGGYHMFTHFKNLKSRLKRLRALLVYSKKRLTSEQIQQIWDILVTKSELRENDQNIFFNWFRTLLSKDRKLLTDELVIDLFRQKIVQCDLEMLKFLRVYGLECIVRLFVIVNELQGNVTDLDP